MTSVQLLSDMQKSDPVLEAVEAVQYGDLPTVRRMISSQEVSASSSDEDECSLLHWAAINNRVAMIVYLIEHGAKVNVLGGVLMESPLHWAVRKSFFRTVKVLVQNGADIALKSQEGISPLLLACNLGNIEMAYFLIVHGADVNDINSTGDTILMTLVKEQENLPKVDVVRLLLRMGADPTFKDRQEGNTVLHILATRRQVLYHKLAFVLFNAVDSSTLSVKNFADQTPREIIDSTKNFAMLRFYSDFYQYKNWSEHIPALASAVSFILLPTLVEAFGWVYGVVGYVILQCLLLDKVMQLSIEFRFSKINQGATWAVIFTLFIVFVKDLQAYVHANTTALFYFLFIAVCILNVGVTTTPPKCVESGEDRSALIAAMMQSSPPDGPFPSKKDRKDNRDSSVSSKPLDVSEVMDRGQVNDIESVTDSCGDDEADSRRFGPEVKLCPICLVDKNLHSTHCKVCNKCMTKDYEHHCSYVNNCITESNRRVFVFFLISCLVGCLMFSYLALSINTYVLCPNQEKFWFEWFLSIERCMAKEHPSLDIMTHISCLLSLWLISLTYGQCAMIAFETTTFELLNDNDDQECIPFDQVQRNICDFIRTGRYRVTRKVERGMRPRWGRVVDEESQSLLGDQKSHCHDHSGKCNNPGCSSKEDLSSSGRVSKYGNRYRLGSFDVEHEHAV